MKNISTLVPDFTCEVYSVNSTRLFHVPHLKVRLATETQRFSLHVLGLCTRPLLGLDHIRRLLRERLR